MQSSQVATEPRGEGCLAWVAARFVGW